MKAMNRRWVLAAAMAVAAIPAAAQMGFSEGFRFLKAVRERDTSVIQEMALDASSNAINARDQATGEGGLHILVRGRDLNLLAYLLARGARPDIAANDGTTPLMLAAQIGWVEGAEQLLARRANVNQSNNRGETALILAVQARSLPMTRLLLGQGADPSQTDGVAGYSAIDYARQDRRPNSAAILRLLEEGPARRPAAPPGPSR